MDPQQIAKQALKKKIILIALGSSSTVAVGGAVIVALLLLVVVIGGSSVTNVAPSVVSCGEGANNVQGVADTTPGAAGGGSVTVDGTDAVTVKNPDGTTFTIQQPGAGVQQAKAGTTAGPIPEDFLAAYQAVSKATGLPWALLAGIGWEETKHYASAYTGGSSAGAQGPMQFMPATFNAYSIDGNGDGTNDILNYKDAIASAANYLIANGVLTSTDGVHKAIWNYNHAEWYINDVLTWAHQYATGTVQTEASRSGDTAQTAAEVHTDGIGTSGGGTSGTANTSGTASNDKDKAKKACDAAELAASNSGGQVVLGGTAGTGTVKVSVSGNVVTLPDHPDVLEAWRGKQITFADARVARGVANGLTWLGLPYSWGGGHGSAGQYPTVGTGAGCYGGCITYGDVNITGFDCSGLMMNIGWGWGISIGGSSGPQVNGAPEKVSTVDAQPGDMLGWPGHVALFLGKEGGNYIVLEAPQSGQTVHVGIHNPTNGLAGRWWNQPPTSPLPDFQNN